MIAAIFIIYFVVFSGNGFIRDIDIVLGGSHDPVAGVLARFVFLNQPGFDLFC